MITKETIDRIFDTTRIEEVVGDFVQLKKRGVNYIGLCPFHNEKTPSFNVNPVRNIYKCFGCGKGGNSVNFVMEHEHYSYPEALRFLAKKYSIEIEETAPDPREVILQDERESLFVLNTFAQKFFTDQLFESEDGRAVALSYFRERGFTEETIRKFQLGFSPDNWSAFSDEALKNGYKNEFLLKTGLSFAKKENENTEEKEARLLDRFRGRVMFPIHNLSGRIIGFGGRILRKADKAAKYVNSPESEIYHKSKSLYGIYFAKKAIVQRDNCYLVEGYTDVISLHQSGIENVVASSGTSLTTEQIRLIGRYTKNVTVLYDGDEAGIKASLRGIDLLLEEGLNVRVVLFPDGDDPDSYRRTHGSSVLVDFIKENEKDFIVFKTEVLLQEVANDPVRKAGLIRDVVETVARIPDPIIRSVYIKKCSEMMGVGEQILLAEMNKSRRNQAGKTMPAEDLEELLPETILKHIQIDENISVERNEEEIIRLLLNFGAEKLQFTEEIEAPEEPSGKKEIIHEVKVAQFIIQEIVNDDITFENTNFNFILETYARLATDNPDIDPRIFCNCENPDVSSVSVSLLSPKYMLSENWQHLHKIYVPEEITLLKEAVQNAIHYLKKRKVLVMLEESRKKLLEAQTKGDDCTELLTDHMRLEQLKIAIAKDVLGIDIIR
jgi:DNA primase